MVIFYIELLCQGYCGPAFHFLPGPLPAVSQIVVHPPNIRPRRPLAKCMASIVVVPLFCSVA